MAMVCRFCGQSFRNRQAVRGHLRTCKAYRTSQPIPGKPARSRLETSGGLDPVDPLIQEVRREETRLKLRQIQSAHRELDTQEAERQRKIRERTEAARQAEEDRRREAGEARAVWAREAARRNILNRIRMLVLHGWGAGVNTLPPALRLRALKDIERELADLPTEDMDSLDILTTARLIQQAVIGPLKGMGDGRR